MARSLKSEMVWGFCFCGCARRKKDALVVPAKRYPEGVPSFVRGFARTTSDATYNTSTHSNESVSRLKCPSTSRSSASTRSFKGFIIVSTITVSSGFQMEPMVTFTIGIPCRNPLDTLTSAMVFSTPRSASSLRRSWIRRLGQTLC